MSLFLSDITNYEALLKASEHFEIVSASWVAKDKNGEKFLALMEKWNQSQQNAITKRRKAPLTPRSVVSTDRDDINKILASICSPTFRLEKDNEGREQVHVASFLNIGFDFQNAGQVHARGIVFKDQTYKASAMTKGVRVFHLEGGTVAVRLEMNGPDGSKAGLVLAKGAEVTTRDALSAKVDAILHELEDLEEDGQWEWLDGKCKKLIFPNIKGLSESNLDYLEGMETDTKVYKVTEFKQRVEFELDSQGAKVESTSAATVIAKGCGGDYVFDKPFYVIVEVDGVAQPLLMGLVGPDSWIVSN